ncbi:hypothetical protein MW290_25590 [Aquincola tertiaricarbonis]|uniref:ParB/Sulfiredoxin domain-containing protein n=1 Tax=Aquincola tertiaricarbonis TaxID=391953 RepID=A0ABY4SCA8_AQUTE|nr:hypothetical protein [Aquincola tertiaricarbonis]URI08945.1 hypothetical protein MW290_25590 [Aquincola tertiaricarbonis]
MKINRNLIRIDGGTQSRVAIDEAVVAEYADRYAVGDYMPPVVLYFDGAHYWLADGFHRYHAAGRAQLLQMDAEVHNGTRRDAVLHSLGANAAHGLRRSNADKRKAVMMVLTDAEWAKWSDREIARRCQVTHPFVASIRASLVAVSSEPAAERTYTTKHGTQAKMDTAGVRAANVARAAEPPPAVGPSTLTVQQQAMPVIAPAERPAQAVAKPAAPAGWVAAPAPAPAASVQQPTAEEVAEDAYGDDPAELLGAAYARITELEELVEAAKADDQKAETLKWRQLYADSSRKQAEAQARAADYQQELQRMSDRLLRICKLFNERDTSKAVALVSDFVRKHTPK